MQREMGVRQPFPLLDQLPAELDGMILDYLWDHTKLHALTGLPEVTVPVSDLAWHLDLPFWASGGKPFMVCPCEVAAERHRHPAQWDRTMAADLRFPLHGRIGSAGKIIIMDGIHRLLKASVLGLPEVTVRILSVGDLNEIAVLATKERI
ncbi:hypothetical protein [Pseudomonas aeruginosa]|uniref:hypothetical protein n=1 Tax=Pseudomonas aeruginosa TaxID=287 RepID=UPI00259CF63E|nr:hypothetical protein [Pseudomonas aeruginosa]MDM4790280.1 hypothetical protein [Pseudomonas aeruginosa]MDM4792644.1 hypothetical protein [Pseudomonas aeruginosa]MDM4835725.1 hypothetical protein [Pseudomonas aeruginosa]MDM4851436.1 hypothetical protein [Pseudomonas aeruginosa]MDM5014632.1 hypothetical protein [Pseudomonas aeruginosa]